MGLSNFMLVTSYLCLKLKSKGILLGSGRGSVGGSLLAYCLKITEINPLQYDLFFSRFLNEARAKTSLPDIDIDVPQKERQEVLKIMKEEFGHDNTYQIINQIRFTEKTAIKDIGRVFGIPFSETNRLTSIIGDRTDIENIPEVQAFFNKYPKVGATISMPLHWDELKPGLKMTDFTIFNALDRLKVEGDLFKGVLDEGIDLEKKWVENVGFYITCNVQLYKVHLTN